MTASSLDPPTLDLDAYLRRIEYSGDLRPTHAVLEALHLAHASHIPFENLDIHLGRPIRLDLASLQAKLVAGGRGGYCFEHNLLLAAVLQRMGFAVTKLAARVRYGAQRTNPRTHMLLLVVCDDTAWVADVGFGLDGLLRPVSLGQGGASEQFGRRYRVTPERDLYVLQSFESGSWADLYAFSLEPQEQADYELANYYTSTHPDSRFVQTLTVQRTTPQVRSLLRDHELSVDDGHSVTTRTLAGDDELLEVLAEVFGLRFAPGTRFRAPRAAA